jgi:hypothetical protein
LGRGCGGEVSELAGIGGGDEEIHLATLAQIEMRLDEVGSVVWGG